MNRAETNPIIPVRLQNSQAASVSAPAKPGEGPRNSSTSEILNPAIAAAFVAGTLAVIAAFPTLRTKFPGPQDSRSQITNKPSIETSDFHVEAVDRDGRRWILKDDETAAVSGTNESSRGAVQTAESLRNEAPKQPAASPEGNANTRLDEVPELALKKPRRETTHDAVAADPRLPSIFDGAAPPIPAFDFGEPPPAPKSAQSLPASSPRAANLQAATFDLSRCAALSGPAISAPRLSKLCTVMHLASHG